VSKFLDVISSVIDVRGFLILCLVFVPLERLFALHKEQGIFRKWWWNDLTYVLFNGFFIRAGMVVLVAGAGVVGRLAVPDDVRTFVAGQPFWLQLVEALILADLGFYFAHRMFHSIPFLWKFHAIHHSIEEMDWLAGSRIHPIDQIVTKGISLLPLFALGFSTATVVTFSWIFFFHSTLLHANVRWNFGPLRWLIASPNYHHWHHANEPAAYNKNYAAQLPLLDKLFGTMHMPNGEEPAKLGVDDPVPKTYVAHLVYPFLPSKTPAQCAPEAEPVVEQGSASAPEASATTTQSTSEQTGAPSKTDAFEVSFAR